MFEFYLYSFIVYVSFEFYKEAINMARGDNITDKDRVIGGRLLKTNQPGSSRSSFDDHKVASADRQTRKQVAHQSG